MRADIFIGDVRKRLADIANGSVQCCVTSPPYWGLRNYGHDEQIGLESTPEQYVNNMVAVFREVWRVLADDGVLWLNLGDSYASNTKGTGGKSDIQTGNAGSFYDPIKLKHGLKTKDLVGIPWRVAFALQQNGWYLRQDIIWHKPNPMPESVTDRCTKSHEYLFMLTKSARYFFDKDAISEPLAASSKQRLAQNVQGQTGSFRQPGKSNGSMKAVGGNGGRRNRRSVWQVPTKPFKGAHFAVMPEALVEPCILATSKPNDTVLDPFAGSGTVAVVSFRHGRNFVGTELNQEYGKIAFDRINSIFPIGNQVVVHLSNNEQPVC